MPGDDQALAEAREAFDRFDWQAASDAFARAGQVLEVEDLERAGLAAGPGEAILMALNGRADAMQDLTGGGVPMLAGRIKS